MTIGRLALAVALVLGVLALAPPPASGQGPRTGQVARIGRLAPVSAEGDRPNLEAFRRALRDLGWTEGRDFVIEPRFADGRAERLPDLAADLVRQRVDLILAGANAGALAAKHATGTIPIVMVTTGDPVRDGLVASLAHPGGNLTGLTALGQALNAKRLELLREAVPGVTRIAVLTNPASAYATQPFLRAREATARALGIQMPVLEAREPARLEAAFARMTAERAGALMVLPDVMFINERRRIVELAARHRLPAMYGERSFVDAGGLMFYGASLGDMYARAASYVDRILRGARPGDLPIEQPTTVELVVNLRPARAMGLTIPPSLLARADQVLE